MSDTAFCPAPHCQRQRPYTVGEDGMRRCGYCRKELGMDEVARGPAEMGLGTVVDELDGRVARLEMRADAAAKTDQDISAWVKGVQDRVEKVEGLGAPVNALLTRVTALEAAVAAELAPIPFSGRSSSPPVSPPGGKKKSRAKKPARSR